MAEFCEKSAIEVSGHSLHSEAVLRANSTGWKWYQGQSSLIHETPKPVQPNLGVRQSSCRCPIGWQMFETQPRECQRAGTAFSRRLGLNHMQFLEREPAPKVR